MISDPEPEGHPSAWRTYKACLQSLGDEDHLVIVQDDAVCVPGFKQGVEFALGAQIVSFFHATWPPVAKRFAWEAQKRRDAFWEVPKGRWIPTVCLGWPGDLARDMLAWSETEVSPEFRGDDGVIGRWANKRRKIALVTTLSLVEHPDDSPSLVASPIGKGRHAILLASNAQEWLDMTRTT